MNEIKVIDLFGGIGGFRLGLEKAGRCRQEKELSKSGSGNFISKPNKRQHSFACIWYCDKDKYAVETYNKNFKEKWKPTDITTVDTSDIPDCDMLCGGFPCQSFSIAGKRKGFQDIRGTMFFEIYRIAQAKRPKILFLENVRGLLSADDGRCFGTILESLGDLGYKVEWQVLNSKYFGVPQNRERVFIIGHLGKGCGREVFPIKTSNSKNTGEYAYCLDANYWKGTRNLNKRQRTMIKVGSMYGTNHQAGSVYDSNGISPCLDDCQGGYREPMIMESLHHHRTGEYGDGKKVEESFTLDSGSGRDLVVHSLQPRSPDRPSLKYSSGGSGHLSRKDGYSYCLDGGNCQAVEYTNNIRRLTPVECERLQGFPDNWTEGVSDTQRYKQLGNAITVNVIQAIGEKILKTMV